jgi:hypothetical protein
MEIQNVSRPSVLNSEMSWNPPERPEWVRLANEGGIAPIAEEAALPLTRSCLLSEAAARQGYSFGSESASIRAFDHPDFPAERAFSLFDQFLIALEEEAELTLIGRWMTRQFLLRLLEVRFQLLSYLAADPGVQEEEIFEPLFVAGAPRTGTTILHTLLATDPEHRVPEGWEFLRPVPPPDPDPELFAADARIALADRELVRAQTVVSDLLSIHKYGGRKPKECLSAMSFAFQSEEFTARYSVPSFERVLQASDPTFAYQMHRLVLQTLQRRGEDTSWVLKSPVHLHNLPALFKTYPDAQVAITHRDPLTLLSSLTSLIANLRWAHSDVVDVSTIAAAHIERYESTFDRLVDWTTTGQLPEDQIHHSHFADFRSTPIQTVQSLYKRFDRPWSAEIEERMSAALKANPSNRHGEHRYDPSELGESPKTLRQRFARYQKQFNVPSDS